MKNTRFPARFLALFLAVCMAASLTALPVWAEGSATITTGVEITAGDVPEVVPEELVGDGGPITVTPVDGDTPANVSIYADIVSDGGNGLEIISGNGESITVEANDITAENYGISITVGSDETGQNTIELTAGNVSASGGESRGVSASAEGGNATVNADAVSVTGEWSVGAEAEAEGGTATINAGNVSASGDESRGVSASVAGSGEATVNADAVSVTGEWSVGAEAEAEGGTAIINAGSVSASGEGSTGISVSVSEGGTANVTVGKDDASGADAAAEGEATVAGETAASSGVQAENAASAAESTGTDASGTEGSAETPAVKADGTGIDVDNFGGKVNVTVDGDVEAATGIDITLSPAVEEVAIGEVTEGTGAVSGQDNAASEQAENKNQTTVTVDGDVNATKTGLSVVESSDFSSGSGPHIGETEKVDVVITGTLSAGEKAVVVDEHVTEDNLSLTVWKIEVDGNAPTENDTLVQPAGGDNGNEAGTSGTVENAYNTGAVSTSESSTSVAADTSIATEPSAGESKTFTDASIQYIIKVEAPDEKKGTLKAVDGNGKALSQSHGYDVAKEGETVTLKVEVEKGYKLTGAYNGEGNSKVPITADANGNYFITVPKGGGVYLSVTLEDDKTEEENNQSENNSQNQNQEQNNQNQNQEQNNQNQQQNQNQEQNNQNQNQEQNNQNQNQEQNNNPIPANAEKVENLIKVSVVSDSGGSNGNGNVNGNDQPPKNEEFGLVVEGTVGSEKLTKIVDEVVDALPTGEALTAMKKGNAIFASAFDSQNAQTLDSGVVNFKGAFGDAKEDKILVPSENDLYWENNTYTVVFSNGTVLRVLCTEYGVLKIPVPKDAAGLGYVVLLGTLESNKAVKKAKAIWDAAYDIGIEKYKGNKTKAKTYADAYAAQKADGKREDYANAFAAQIADGKDEQYAYYYAFGKAEMGIKNEEEAIKYADMRAEGKSAEYCQDYIRWYEGRINEGKDYAATWAKEFCDKYHIDRKSGDYAKAYADKIADGKGDVYAAAYAEKIDDSWPEEKAKSYAESYAESYADVYRAQIAGGIDPNYAKDYANAYAAQKAAGISDVYAAGYAAAIADGKDEAEAKAAGMAAEDAAQNALNAQQSAASANAAGTTEATTAAVNRGDVANNAQQSAANANAAGTTWANSFAGGAVTDTFLHYDISVKPAFENAQQSAANANTGGTPEAASAAGGPAADPDIIRDDDALVAAAVKSSLEDAQNARNAQRSAANANAAGTTTEATSAAGGDAAGGNGDGENSSNQAQSGGSEAWRRLEAVRGSLNGDALMDGHSVWYRVHSQTYGWLGWAHDGEPAGTAGLAKRAEAIDVQVLPQGQVPRGYDSTQRAPAANTAGTPEAASAAGGPAADPDIIRDNDALLDAAVKSALEDARNARQTNNANAAGTTTEATSAAGGDAAHAGSFDDDDLAALFADALNSILENDQNARNAQQSAATANAAGTTGAASAANAYAPAPDDSGHRITGDHSGALGD